MAAAPAAPRQEEKKRRSARAAARQQVRHAPEARLRRYQRRAAGKASLSYARQVALHPPAHFTERMPFDEVLQYCAAADRYLIQWQDSQMAGYLACYLLHADADSILSINGVPTKAVNTEQLPDKRSVQVQWQPSWVQRRDVPRTWRFEFKCQLRLARAWETEMAWRAMERPPRRSAFVAAAAAVAPPHHV